VSTRPRRSLRRTDLFLVRMWTEDAIAPIEAGHTGNGRNSVSGADQDEWSGSVQRVVDGEACQFKGLQSLVDALLAMLSETRDKLDK
jgi:hypothetical protein